MREHPIPDQKHTFEIRINVFKCLQWSRAPKRTWASTWAFWQRAQVRMRCHSIHSHSLPMCCALFPLFQDPLQEMVCSITEQYPSLQALSVSHWYTWRIIESMCCYYLYIYICIPTCSNESYRGTLMRGCRRKASTIAFSSAMAQRGLLFCLETICWY